MNGSGENFGRKTQLAANSVRPLKLEHFKEVYVIFCGVAVQFSDRLW